MTQEQEIERILTRFNTSFDDETHIIDCLQKIIQKLEPNFVLLSDAYKYSHPELYTDGLTKLISYLESRGGKFNEVVFFGLQIIMKKYLVGPVLSKKMIEEAELKLNSQDGVFNSETGFSEKRWYSLLEKHNGYLPIRIKAVPEGSVIPVKNVLSLIEHTDDEFAWLVSHIETLFLQVWYPITVATLSRELKKIVIEYMLKTGTDPNMVEVLSSFVVNDFGMRGTSSMESAGIGDAAHLVSNNGSDTIIGSSVLQDYYHAAPMYGKSIKASEHSIMTMEGPEGELNVMRRILTKFPDGYIAMVCDSYDVFHNAKQYICKDLKELILSRNGTFVMRLDSGDPKMTIKTIFNILFDGFEYTTNDMGFKVLPSQIRVLQSDGMNIETIREIYEMLHQEKIAAENFVIGIGGKLLQAGIDRDVQNFAVKACYAVINGVGYDLVKSPKEMDSNGEIHMSFKKSKKGLMKLVKDGNSYRTVLKSETPDFDDLKDELVPVFENGKLLVDYTIEEIRNLGKIDF